MRVSQGHVTIEDLGVESLSGLMTKCWSRVLTPHVGGTGTTRRVCILSEVAVFLSYTHLRILLCTNIVTFRKVCDKHMATVSPDLVQQIMPYFTEL